MKEILGIVAILLTLIAVIPYIRDILLNKIKPHAFSWFIWGLVTLIIFAAEISSFFYSKIFEFVHRLIFRYYLRHHQEFLEIDYF